MSNFEKSSAPPAYTDNPPEGQAGYPPQAGYQGYAAPPAYPSSGYPQGQNVPPQGYGPGQGQGYWQPQGYSGNVVVAQPVAYPVQAGPAPNDYMCAAIFATLCCFWPTGIVAIMRASDARNALARGDIAGATVHARSAKSMVTISVVVGIIVFVVMAIIIGIYIGVVLNSIHDDY